MGEDFLGVHFCSTLPYGIWASALYNLSSNVCYKCTFNIISEYIGE